MNQLYIDNIFREVTKNDKSFREKGLFGPPRYSQSEIREAWFNGIKHGIEAGLRKASLEGQKIELTRNTTNVRHTEFLKKFYKLAEEYNCEIQFHPEHGMVVLDREY